MREDAYDEHAISLGSPCPPFYIRFLSISYLREAMACSSADISTSYVLMFYEWIARTECTSQCCWRFCKEAVNFSFISAIMVVSIRYTFSSSTFCEMRLQQLLFFLQRLDIIDQTLGSIEQIGFLFTRHLHCWLPWVPSWTPPPFPSSTSYDHHSAVYAIVEDITVVGRSVWSGSHTRNQSMDSILQNAFQEVMKWFLGREQVQELLSFGVRLLHYEEQSNHLSFEE